MISPNLRSGNRRGTRGPRFRSGPGTVPGSDALAVCVQEQQRATTLSSLEEGEREGEGERAWLISLFVFAATSCILQFLKEDSSDSEVRESAFFGVFWFVFWYLFRCY